jgi:hypothetical protein
VVNTARSTEAAAEWVEPWRMGAGRGSGEREVIGGGQVGMHEHNVVLWLGLFFLPGHDRGFGPAKVWLTPYRATLGPPPMVWVNLLS